MNCAVPTDQECKKIESSVKEILTERKYNIFSIRHILAALKVEIENMKKLEGRKIQKLFSSYIN